MTVFLDPNHAIPNNNTASPPKLSYNALKVGIGLVASCQVDVESWTLGEASQVGAMSDLSRSARECLFTQSVEKRGESCIGGVKGGELEASDLVGYCEGYIRRRHDV